MTRLLSEEPVGFKSNSVSRFKGKWVQMSVWLLIVMLPALQSNESAKTDFSMGASDHDSSSELKRDDFNGTTNREETETLLNADCFYFVHQIGSGAFGKVWLTSEWSILAFPAVESRHFSVCALILFAFMFNQTDTLHKT